MPLSISEDQARRLRMRSNLLRTGEAPSLPVTEVLSQVGGVQAQELPAALLSVRARSRGITAKTIEEARQERRTLVRTWLMRGTLYLAAARDAAWLVPLFGPIFIPGDRRRMAELGWDETREARGMRLVQKALDERETLTRPEIIRLLQAEGLPFEGQAPIHLIFRLAFEGWLCCGPDRGKEPTFVPLEAWAGPLHPRPRPEALADLARRYLTAYAPAGQQDFAAWSGLPARDSRQAWDAIQDSLAPVDIAGKPACILADQLPWLDEIEHQPPTVRLLPRYDTFLLGYAKRSLAVASANEKNIHPGGGQIRASVLVDGRAAGTWQSRQQRGRLEITVQPFAPLPKLIISLLEAEVQDVGRFLGLEAEFNPML